MAEPLRLLLLSAGGAVAQNIVDALGGRRESCVLIGTNSIADAVGNFRCDTVYLVPPAVSGAEYIERVAELIRSEKPDLVIPCRDDDIVALAILRERSPGGHPVLLTGSVAAARMMQDKIETARFAARHGLPFAPTAENAAEAIELAWRHGLPLLGKPRMGNASRGVVLLRSAEEIRRAFEASADLIAQPYLDPPANINAVVAPFEGGMPLSFSFPGLNKHSVDVIVGPDGSLSRSFGTLCFEVGGRVVEYRRRDDADLLDLGQAYARAAAAEGWRGPLNVQLKRTHEGKLVAFELNGRLNGATAARSLMGFDELGEVVARFVPVAQLPAIPAQECDIVQLSLASFALPRAAVSTLQTTGAWSRKARH